MRKHTGQLPFACSLCPKRCTNRSNLNYHIRNYHPDQVSENNNNMLIFSSPLRVMNATNKDQPTHANENKKQQKCNDCGKVFAQKCSLVTHMRLHSGSLPFSCTSCGRKFATGAHLNYHTNSLHNKEVIRFRQCDYQAKNNNNNNNVNQKSRTNSGALLLYPCIFCEKKFSCSSSLMYHVRSTHTGEKMLKCDQCEYETASTSAFKNHARTHNGQKPFQCHICEKAFSQLSNLKRHVQIPHKIYVGV